MTWKSLISHRLTGWHLALAGLLALAGIFVCAEAWLEILEVAQRDEEYQHIFLVPFVCLWIIWVRRSRFRHCRPSGTFLGPLIVAAGWGLSWYGFNRQTTSFFHLGAVVVLIGCVISVLGKNVLFRFFPAILVLGFLIPAPGDLRQRIAQPLQEWTAQASQLTLDVMGVETERSGNLMFIDGRPVMIEEACNGMRMVFPLFLIGYAFSFGLPLKQNVRILIILCSPVVALACNVMRTVPLIWVQGRNTHLSAADAKAVFDFLHNYGGWIMLPIAFVLLLTVIRMLKWAMVPVQRYTLASQ